jgi:predicted ArsR family transcriptional regulator
MTTTAEQIHVFLRDHPGATSGEISRALECTPANVRYHLARLIEHGEVEVTGQEARREKGRPVLRYGLSLLAQEQNLAVLASVLLDEITLGFPGEDGNALLERAARRLAGAPPAPSQRLTTRLVNAVRRLNQLSYHARWEAHASGPRIFLAHCPYAALLPRHAASLCRFDAALVAALAGCPVQPLTSPGAYPCAFAAVDQTVPAA